MTLLNLQNSNKKLKFLFRWDLSHDFFILQTCLDLIVGWFKTFTEFSIYQQLHDIGNGTAKREKLCQLSKLKPFWEEDIPKKYHLTSLFLLFFMISMTRTYFNDALL